MWQPDGLALFFAKLQSIERELDLLSRQIAGVYYWPVIRSTIFDGLSHDLGLLDLPAAQTARTRAMRVLTSAITHRAMSPWPLRDRFETVIVPFPRKHVRNGQHADFATQRALSDAGLGRILVLEWDEAAVAAHRQSGRSVRSASYHRAVAAFRAAPQIVALLGEVASERRRFENALKSELGVACPLSDAQIALRIAFFSEGRKLARQFFDDCGAKQVLFAGGYAATGGLVAGAQDCGMKTIDLQHGVITALHPAYHYAGRPDVPYAPDAILLFGRYWQSAAELPARTRTAVIGSENISHVRSRRRERKTRSVLAVSQRTIGARMFADMLAVAAAAPEWQFVFRAHPWEEADGYRRHVATDAAISANLRVAAPAESIYDLMNSAEVQIGVYSTGLFEGMALGLRTIVLAHPGAEHMRSAIECGDAVLAQSPSEIVSLLPVAPVSRDPEKYYAEPLPSIAAVIEGLHAGS